MNIMRANKLNVKWKFSNAYIGQKFIMQNENDIAAIAGYYNNSSILQGRTKGQERKKIRTKRRKNDNYLNCSHVYFNLKRVKYSIDVRTQVRSK